MQEGVITSFQTRRFGKGYAHAPEIRITVPDLSTSDEAFRQVQAAPTLLELHLMVEIKPPQTAPPQSGLHTEH